MMTPTNSTASKEDQVHGKGTGINQTLTGVDQMVLLPLRTIRVLQNEVAELRSMFVMFKKDVAKQLEIETNASDGDDRSMQVDLEDLAARKVAVKRVRGLAQDHHSGAHLKFVADIVGVGRKSKVDNRFV